MAKTLTLRNVPDQVVRELRLRAQRNGRSMQSELLTIVKQATIDQRSFTEQLDTFRRATARPLSLDDIQHHVSMFLAFARSNPQMEFEVTNIGCGLAGFHPSEIAPMFQGAPSNCHFTEEFRYYLDYEIREALGDVPNHS